ncbi:tumor protein D52 isoform X2 [Lampris incognitus]|uniref:tumor protein D52 isoform X2 n=1 Tax=Lampris incognitus TaxID=2546036 RepID=UPI0024B61C7E|nr:tumor protein D52 isoform X2 [Lampris incognitus]
MDPLEEYHSPFDFEQGVNTSYLYLSPAYGDTPPDSPAVKNRGSQQHPDATPEQGEDMASTLDQSFSSVPTLTDEEREELQEELARVENEIQTLSQVLTAKEKQLADIKRKLGITPLNELKQNISKGWQEVTTSNVYKKTSETFSQASQKATAAFSSMGSAISRKLEDVRNTPSFKTFEEKVETFKTKMSPSASYSTPVDQFSSNADPESNHSQPDDVPIQEAPTH